MPRLTPEYLQDHMDGEFSGNKYEAYSPETFANALIDHILATAKEQLKSTSEEQDEVQLSLPVTLRAVDVGAEGCVEICVGGGPIPAQVCYHKGFKGSKPGPG